MYCTKYPVYDLLYNNVLHTYYVLETLVSSFHQFTLVLNLCRVYVN